MGGQDKLMLIYRGKTLLLRAVELLDSFDFHKKIIVTTEERLERVTLPDSVRAVINRNPEAGQSGSLRLGLEAANGEWYLFLTADQPKLTPECLRPLFDLAAANTGGIIYPSVNGKPCSPVLFHACFRAELSRLTGDSGGRAVRAAHPERCLTFETDMPDCFDDIDNENDYKKLIGAGCVCPLQKERQ